MQDKSCTDGYKTNVIWKLCLNFSPPAKSLPWPMQREPRTRPCLGLWTMFRCMVENFPMAMAWQIRTILQVETSKESIAQSFNVVYLVHVPKYNCIFPANFKPVCCPFFTYCYPSEKVRKCQWCAQLPSSCVQTNDPSVFTITEKAPTFSTVAQMWKR